MDMDYIREFDIRLEKEMYYAGETLSGTVILDTTENFKLRAVRVMLRGKAHTEWKVMVSGDRRTVKDDQYFIDDRAVIWGKEKAEGAVPILPRGHHQFPFRFQLPESSLPCSFESKPGTIRYYIKVTVDIPYASPPQGMKYFTIIGPHIDCMDHLRPIRGEAGRRRCCLCCESGKVSLRTDFERSAYVCGESLRVKADIDNQSEEEARLKLRIVQYVEYYIDRGVLGVQKEVSHTVMDYRGAPVTPNTRSRWDSQQNLVVPTMPTTLVGLCRLIQIHYILKVNVELEKSGEDLHMNFPITIATVPFRIPNSNQTPLVSYDVASDHVEGGMYIGPEFLLGQVYDGTLECGESIVLYRPVYPTVKSSSYNKSLVHSTSISTSQPQSTASTPNATKGHRIDLSNKELPTPGTSGVKNPPPGSMSTAKNPSSSKGSTNVRQSSRDNLRGDAATAATIALDPDGPTSTRQQRKNDSSASSSSGGGAKPGSSSIISGGATAEKSKKLGKRTLSTTSRSDSTEIIVEGGSVATEIKKWETHKGSRFKEEVGGPTPCSSSSSSSIIVPTHTNKNTSKSSPPVVPTQQDVGNESKTGKHNLQKKSGKAVEVDVVDGSKVDEQNTL